MLVIPAIDLKGGQCVRLLQGKKEAVTTYSNDPSAIAKLWESCGAKLLHIVDLDGAFSGNQKNLNAIIKIRQSVKIALQVGGGIRKIGNIIRLFSAGIDRIIIGTAAIEDPEFLTDSCKRYPGRILIGIDAKDGMVAIRGWEEITSLKAQELAKRLEVVGAAGIIYTDISRDGMLSGPNIDAIREMVENVKILVIASGGVSCIEDIKNLLQIKNLWGVITGKAIYSKAINLKEAIKFVTSYECLRNE
ncbi:MAG: 1-(5-phosphoribosyl)-5-[(5-phosphoribosylamino)methylideneamino]imidazole-4-carboxamide isomerase [Nitrospirae bacterium CG_4_10_14_0_8_um_filter_41_23]|nr:MAG: 1-(5-phosphoribosyl)-5-[(5-phosphoribosylamino)methylideneamino]imidazole-4-carboxamide isomerase [Nitrospirae bacterium CG2_30_41_42]PIQ95166.1 MAG: 1-(5-phosphoribosyl)-5-[(5-phosphoribosylamino)methylideneamino]imidazole-4-carboxamide isomerase [Nitrospirae bacterium CG11_big_fil_rev_8_21_14_0_20_41_14]PIV42264.1 MAG: 1-(5-phosphoribosyl)-5-[(5-phosphoribosylamino)methylideneamino]imidazole-4-carboxamide isomerase [Nitrospirae bacterium CG02_land_8_20_14_3_00_41_53]PIW87234.1 MAG: 1-(